MNKTISYCADIPAGLSGLEHSCVNKEDEKRIHKKQDPSQQHQIMDSGHLC